MSGYIWIKAKQVKRGTNSGIPDPDGEMTRDGPGEGGIDRRTYLGEYRAVADRIAQSVNSGLETFSPQAPNLVSVGDGDPLQMAARIQFPVWGSPRVTIIVTVNDIKLSTECLYSISANTRDVPYEVIAVNDGSTDKIADVLARIENLRCIEGHDDRSVSLLCNQAARHARGNFLAFLNNDVQVGWNWLRPLMETFSRHSNAGAAGPKVLSSDGRLEQAGIVVNADGSLKGAGGGEDPRKVRYDYPRDVDCLSGVGLMIETQTFREVSGFDTRFTHGTYAGADLCYALRQKGKRLIYNPASVIIQRGNFDGPELFPTLANRQLFAEKWQTEIDDANRVRLISFYYPQTTSIQQAQSADAPDGNKVNRVQPIEEEIRLGQKYGIHGWCFYYDAGGGLPFNRIPGNLGTRTPFCLCVTGDIREEPVADKDAIAPRHSGRDYKAVIQDIIGHLRHPDYIRLNGKPLLLISDPRLFSNMPQAMATWRRACAAEGIGAIYLAMLEPADQNGGDANPAGLGSDAMVEFPPRNLPALLPLAGGDPEFMGRGYDYRDIVLHHVRREIPNYVRFRTVIPSWNDGRPIASSMAANSSPGAYQAWLENALTTTREQYSGDERVVFIHAWNDRRGGLQPDRRYGHGYLEATRNALDSACLGLLKPR